jgi:hypothetical protein
MNTDWQGSALIELTSISVTRYLMLDAGGWKPPLRLSQKRTFKQVDR